MAIMRAPFVVVVIALFAAGCATVPGQNYPKEASTAFAHPETTKLGRQLQARAPDHPEVSGFRLLVEGIDGFLIRAEMANAAEQTLDLQYYIIQNDNTGKLLMDAVLRAADRGVRVRMLIDDNDDTTRNAQITALSAHKNIEIRIFNPFFSRGVFHLLRYPEFLFAGTRLNYRMHNKLYIADNAIAVLGGRNVGDEYFEVGNEKEFVDADVVTAGPLVRQESKSFDDYWNSVLAIPAEGLVFTKADPRQLDRYRAELAEHRGKMQGSNYVKRLATNEPLEGIAAAGAQVIWAQGELLYDSPEKFKVEAGEKSGPLLRQKLGEAIAEVEQELIVVSPYLVPGEEGMKLLKDLRARGVRIRILTNSLASTDVPIVHAGYQHYRVPLLEEGVELYEVRPVLTEPAAGNGGPKSPSSSRYALHAKVFILDRRRVFIGSMNFDRRSMHLNTEVGVLIESPDIARQTLARFDTIAQPANCYIPTLISQEVLATPILVWRTQEDGKMVESSVEPMGDLLRGVSAELLTLLPIDDLL
jgi:putative cardiolipin synthase